MSSYLGTFPAAAAASFFYSQLYLNDFETPSQSRQNPSGPQQQQQQQQQQQPPQQQSQQQQHHQHHHLQQQQQQIQGHAMPSSNHSNSQMLSSHQLPHGMTAGDRGQRAASISDNLNVWRPY